MNENKLVHFTNLRVLTMTQQAIMTGMQDLTRCLVWLSGCILENQTEGQNVCFRLNLNLNLLRFKPMWIWRLVCFRDTGIVLHSQLFGDLWKEQICLNSLLCIPKHGSSPACLGRTSAWYSTFLEYMYIWMVIQFINIYVLKCDLQYLVYLFISINPALPYDASYLMCNTNLIYYLLF